MQFKENCKDIRLIWDLYNFSELQLEFLHLLTRYFKQLYERVQIRYILTAIPIVGRIVQMRTKLYKKNKSLFFDAIKNGQIFPSKVWCFQYGLRFTFSRELGNIRTCKEARLQEPIKFRLRDSIRFSIF